MTTTLLTGHETPAPAPGEAAAPAARVRWPWVALALSLLSWAVSLPGLKDAPISQFGLLASGPPTFPLALVLTAVAFVGFVRHRHMVGAVASLGALVVVERFTLAIISDAAPYSWTYKHLAVVDLIQERHALERSADVYNNWPGLFSATAWFSDVTGMSPFALAHWFTPVYHLVLLTALGLMLRLWGLRPSATLVALFLFEAIDWVGQDYYSPQATAFLLAVGVLTMLSPPLRHRPAAAVAALVMYGAIVVTHQLTPMWLLVLVGGMFVFRKLPLWWVVPAMALMVGAFFLFNWTAVAGTGFTLFKFDPVSNTQSNIKTVGVYGQRVTAGMVRGLALAVWTSAAVVAAYQLWRRRPRWDAYIMAFSGFVILLGQSYGGEAIFRVYLYSLPGCCLLLAPGLLALCRSRRPGAMLSGLLLSGAVLLGAQGYVGGWFANRMSAHQVNFSHDLLGSADYPSYLTMAAPVWPERINARYVDFLRFDRTFDASMVFQANLVGSNFDTDEDYRTFTRTIEGRSGGPTYLIITRQMRVYDWYYGILPWNALDNLQARIAQDSRWERYYDSDEIIVYKTKAWAP